MLRQYDLDALVLYVKRHQGTRRSVEGHRLGHADIWTLHTVVVKEGVSNNEGKIWTSVAICGISSTNRSGTWDGDVHRVLALAKADLNIPIVEAIELPKEDLCPNES